MKGELACTSWLTKPCGDSGLDNGQRFLSMVAEIGEVLLAGGDNWSVPAVMGAASLPREAAWCAWHCGLQNMLELSCK